MNKTVACLLQVAYRVGTGGSCGFGPIGDPYPDSAIASIRSTSAIVAQLPESGCGVCIQLTCADQVRGPTQNAVLQTSTLTVLAVFHSVHGLCFQGLIPGCDWMAMHSAWSRGSSISIAARSNCS